jgi:filamentous hemagglutinin family protein
LLRAAAAWAIVFLVSHGVHAQTHTVIKTDNNWGRTARTLLPSSGAASIVGNGGTTHQITGNVFTIPENLGKSAGQNLFHSFERFNVGAGDAALFTTTNAYVNVITRISGLSPSTINGLLMLQPAAGTRPNFFFINPNGVTFGQGAQIDVPAAFYVSTADRLEFKNFVWSASTPSGSSMTVAPPEAFGFLSKLEPVAVTFNNVDANATKGAQPSITLPAGAALHVVAGAARFDSVNISVPDGALQVRSTGTQAVQVPIDGKVSTPLNGPIDLVGTTLSTQGSGTIALEGGPMTFVNSIVQSDNAASRPAGSIMLTSSGAVSIVDGSKLSTVTSSAADAASIRVDAQSLTIDGKGRSTGIMSKGTKDASGNDTGGNAANVTVNVSDELAIANGGQISSDAESNGHAGKVTISARSITLEGYGQGTQTGIFSNAQSGSGDAGTVKVTAGETLTIRNGAQVSSNSSDAGAAGAIDVTVQSLLIEGDAAEVARGSGKGTGILSSALIGSHSGHVGTIEIKARGEVVLNNQARLDIANYARLAFPVEIDGGFISIVSPHVVLTGGSQITAETGGNVTGANVFLLPAADGKGNLLIAGDGTGKITSSINVPANAIGGIGFRSGRGFGFFPRAGNADAGNVDIRASNATLSGVNVISETSAGSNAPAGKITLAVSGTLSILHNTRIATDTAGSASAGDLRIDGGSVLLLDHSQITTSGSGQQSGNGGNIELTAKALVMNSGFIQANTGGAQASGGNVVIDAGVVVPGGALIVGGDTPARFVPGRSGINVIQAAAPDGISGNVTVAAPLLDIAGTLKGLSSEVIDARVPSRDLCRVGASSSLTPLGRGGLRPTAMGWTRPEGVATMLADRGSTPQKLTVSSMANKANDTAQRCEQ